MTPMTLKYAWTIPLLGSVLPRFVKAMHDSLQPYQIAMVTIRVSSIITDAVRFRVSHHQSTQN